MKRIIVLIALNFGVDALGAEGESGFTFERDSSGYAAFYSFTTAVSPKCAADRLYQFEHLQQYLTEFSNLAYRGGDTASYIVEGEVAFAFIQ